MNIGFYNELRRYNARQQSKRRDAIVFKAAMLCAVFLIVLGVFG